jgi:hypothetical protein
MCVNYFCNKETYISLLTFVVQVCQVVNICFDISIFLQLHEVKEMKHIPTKLN